MKIALIVAMSKEMKLLLPLINNRVENKLNDLVLVSGLIGPHEVCAMQCGIGKVNSAVRTWCLIDEFHPDLVINTGVAGGAAQDMKPLDVIVATGVTYSDVWCGPGTEFGAAYGFDKILIPSGLLVDQARQCGGAKFGLICSGDMFISKTEEVERIAAQFPEVKAVDMESGSIAQVSVMCGVPFGVIRVISDNPLSGVNIAQYEDFWGKAPEATFALLSEILEKLPV